MSYEESQNYSKPKIRKIIYTSTCGCVCIFYYQFLAFMSRDENIIELKISEIDLYVINKVREIRIPKHISQLNLSILMGLAEGAIGKIENPKQRAKYNIRHLNLLAKALKCSPKDFLPEKPLANDLIKVKIRFKKVRKTNEPSFEIIEKKKHKLNIAKRSREK